MVSSVKIEYPKTAIQKGSIPVTGTLVVEYDRTTDVLVAWSKVVDESATNKILSGEQQVDRVASEVGAENIEYREYTRYKIPSRITLLRFREKWQAETRYAAAIIANYFDIDPAKVREHLARFV